MTVSADYALPTGIHDISPEFYESDPCAAPSLRASGIKVLLTESPADFAALNPRLTQWPELLTGSTKRQDEGTVAHAKILGKGYSFIAADPEDAPVLTEKRQPYKSWAGKAEAWRDEQRAKGIIVISKEKDRAADLAADSVRALLSEEYGPRWLNEGLIEYTLVWQRQTSHGPIWCRARLDYLDLKRALILDVKTREQQITDKALSDACAYDMWHIQAAWQIEGVVANCPELAGRVTHRFPVARVVPPFGARFFDPSESWLTIAGQRIDRAAELFAKCLYSKSWPELPKVSNPQPPTWLISEFEAEEACA